MPIRILIVLDENFRFAPHDGDTRSESIQKFNYTVLVGSLEAAGIEVTKANRDPDPTADIANFTFDGPTDLSDFDALWLIGDAGFNTNSAFGSRISDAEIRAIAEFMDTGSGVFATGDHDGIGSYMSGWLPRVRAMRKWFARNDTTPEIPDDFYVDDDYTVRNWPAVGPKRADTIRNNVHGDGTAWFENQSDSTPQTITPTTTPAHAILQGPHGIITNFPDHMHEGGCLAGFPGFDFDQTLTFDGVAFVEFPTLDSHRELPQIIATGEVQNHPTPSVRGAPFPQSEAAEPRNPYGIFSVYDGFKAGVGRVVTGSTFHHYVDLNLTGDAEVDLPGEIASVGEDAQDGEGFNYTGTADVFDEIKTVYVNIAKWLARPQRAIQLILDRSTFGEDEVAAVSDGTFPESVFVVVEGLKPSDFPVGGITTLNPNSAQLNNWAPDVQTADANILVEPTGVKSDMPDLPGTFQRFTFEYQVRFLNDTPFTSFTGDTREVPVAAALSAGGLNLNDAAFFQLIKTANPYMLDLADNATHHWLSSDIRVFPVVVGEGSIAGQSLNSGSKPLLTSSCNRFSTTSAVLTSPLFRPIRSPPR